MFFFKMINSYSKNSKVYLNLIRKLFFTEKTNIYFPKQFLECYNIFQHTYKVIGTDISDILDFHMLTLNIFVALVSLLHIQ